MSPNARKVVYEAVTASQALESAEITDGANLEKDLNAESLDLLDIEYRIAKGMGVRIPNDEFRVRLNAVTGDDAYTYESVPGTVARLIEMAEHYQGPQPEKEGA